MEVVLDIKEFKYILTIAQQGSISQAAEKLFISQPSLSQFLKNYEDSLNTQLFNRTPSGVQPTSAGWRFIEIATNITEMYNTFQRELVDIKQFASDKVTIGIPGKRVTILSDILVRCSKQCPNITVNVLEALSNDLEKELENNNLDVALLTGPIQANNLCCRLITSEEMFLAAAKNHPVLEKSRTGHDKRRWVEIEDLRGEEYFILEKGHRTYDFSKDFFKKNKIEPRMIRECCSFEVSISWAGVGTGLVFLPQTFLSQIGQLSRNIEYFSIGEQGLRRGFYIATKKNYKKTLLLDTLLNIIAETLKDYFNNLA
jgi:LysR family hydrogen peroxide-inducible transcriptional activator